MPRSLLTQVDVLFGDTYKGQSGADAAKAFSESRVIRPKGPNFSQPDFRTALIDPVIRMAKNKRSKSACTLIQRKSSNRAQGPHRGGGRHAFLRPFVQRRVRVVCLVGGRRRLKSILPQLRSSVSSGSGFLQHLLRNQSIETDDPKATGVFIYDILPRVLQERRTLAERVAKAGSVASPDDPAALLDRASVFRDPGLDHDRVGIESLMSPGSSRRDQLLAEHAR